MCVCVAGRAGKNYLEDGVPATAPSSPGTGIVGRSNITKLKNTGKNMQPVEVTPEVTFPAYAGRPIA